MEKQILLNLDLSKSLVVVCGKKTKKCVDNDFILRLVYSLSTSHSVLVNTLIPIENAIAQYTGYVLGLVSSTFLLNVSMLLKSKVHITFL